MQGSHSLGLPVRGRMTWEHVYHLAGSGVRHASFKEGSGCGFYSDGNRSFERYLLLPFSHLILTTAPGDKGAGVSVPFWHEKKQGSKRLRDLPEVMQLGNSTGTKSRSPSSSEMAPPFWDH